MAPTKTRGFISYSQDPVEHSKRVHALANQLRADGIEAWIDQYVEFLGQIFQLNRRRLATQGRSVRQFSLLTSEFSAQFNRVQGRWRYQRHAYALEHDSRNNRNPR